MFRIIVIYCVTSFFWPSMSFVGSETAGRPAAKQAKTCKAASADDVNHIAIGYFGPTDPCDRDAQTWLGVTLAFEQANIRGGSEGMPFELYPGWSEDPWGSGVKEVVRMAYLNRVLAIIGGPDGPSTHLAEQVVTKARLTLISPANCDRTANLANVPWMFSCLPPDSVQASVLGRLIKQHIGSKDFVVISAVDHDSHLFAVQLKKAFTREGIAPSHHFHFEPQSNTTVELVQEVLSKPARALVVLAEAAASARTVKAIRKHGYDGTVYGGPCMGQNLFLDEAGSEADGVIFPLLFWSSESETRDFEHQFESRFGFKPDYRAAHAFDAANLLIATIKQVGPGRMLIREAIANMKSYKGVTGLIRWDSQGSNSRAVIAGTIRSGSIEPLQKPE